MRIALIRHPAPLIEPGICYGRLDVPLAPTAEQQIGGIAADPALRGAVRVWTGPATRCRRLADAIAVALAVPSVVDPRLRELDFGDWEGLSWDAVPRADLDRWADTPLRFAPPGGESGSALVDRVRDVLARLREDRQDCVVVSHGGPLKVLTALLLGVPLDLLVAAPPMGVTRFITIPVDESPVAERGKRHPGGRIADVPATG